jgi:hypothetical protein
MPLTTRTVYFENPVGRISEHAAGYALVQYQPGKRVFSEFQALLTHLGHLLQRRGWHKVLTDQRVMTPFTEPEQTWIREQWMSPALGQRPQTLVAVLLPHDVYARLASNLVMQDAREGALTYHIFEEEAAAGAWLQQAP